jgi:hypothetical protein
MHVLLLLFLLYLPTRHVLCVVVGVQQQLERPHGEEERHINPAPPRL